MNTGNELAEYRITFKGDDLFSLGMRVKAKSRSSAKWVAYCREERQCDFMDFCSSIESIKKISDTKKENNYG